MSALIGKVAVVTGGAQGIGRAIAYELAEAGALVAIADIEDGLAEEAAADLRQSDRDALAFTVDVSDRSSIEQVTQSVLHEWGHIDILVNDAGISCSRPALELTDGDWSRVLSINLTGVFLCSQLIGRDMVQRRHGRIINIASSSALFGAPGLAAYAASKAGVLGLTRVMAVELGPSGITVNAICPGNIATDLLQTVFAERAASRGVPLNDVIDGIVAKTPVGRLGEPKDVASLAVFLASPGAAYITGQVFNVCGGRTINLS